MSHSKRMCFWKLSLYQHQRHTDRKLSSGKRRMPAWICSCLHYSAIIFIFRDKKECVAVWKTVQGPFTFCYLCLLAHNIFFLQNTKLMVGTCRSCHTWSSLHQVKCNFVRNKAKGFGFLETPVPSWMLSVPTKLFWYIQK